MITINGKSWLHLIVGPNGAGKTTLYENIIKPSNDLAFINADIIQKNEIRNDSLRASIRAALIAGRRRQEHLKNKQSFITETVFASKSDSVFLKKVREAGFGISIYHVGVRLEDLSVERVKSRVSKGGHDVPEDKIRQRFKSNKEAIRQAVIRADYAYVYDNSALARSPSLQIVLEQGRVVTIGDKLEKWCSELYSDEIRKAKL